MVGPVGFEPTTSGPGPVGFEPTTSGPDFSGSPAPQGHRPRLDSGILWAGSIPLTKLDDGPQRSKPNRAAFLCYARISLVYELRSHLRDEELLRGIN